MGVKGVMFGMSAHTTMRRSWIFLRASGFRLFSSARVASVIPSLDTFSVYSRNLSGSVDLVSRRDSQSRIFSSILAFHRTDIVSEGPLCSWPRPLSHQAPSIPPSASRRSCSQFLYYAAAGRRRCLSRTFLGETYRGHERFVRTLSSRLTLGLARRVV